ncbi:ATP-binding protein [Pseudomonas fluorescens]|uniref:histidine kinase n=1 Tax=Pseudomonas fluorescens (strain Pf0-1) TaxID=205922 RepID=Q3K792_PSEPF|nr:sensor histidine kinase [Pseudomonas fluorescens]ABA76362.1 histidine kinase [Pseudomonas fluorescens Pf0-1]MBY9024290.1 ATP-binding protein [Pseudomonas fluorescens]MBY9030603.1 ATP-binding protein [Pseudomonas fluorescens]MBY9035793.1 ATP-binding protein [Pseudomonas fluorescens]MBY9042493.1 ATP-binding protein [Pseudomonas fluorescens]
MKELLDELPFEIAARLPIQLGRQSISSSMVAISELIKNSYDADSKKVKLTFTNSKDNLPSLIIEDDGEGMSYEDVKENWLIIGTSHKTHQDISEKYRVYTGAKGLGRLGADRLCKTLVLQTKQESDQAALELQIEWEAYENAEKPLSQIKHKLYKHTSQIQDRHGKFPDNEKNSGTRVILQGLKDDWNLNLLTDLKKELSLLISPFDETNDFSISIQSDFPEVNGNVSSSSAVEYARWVVDAELDGEIINANFRYSDGREFKINSEEWKNWIKDRPPVPSSGPLKLKMYFIPWDAPGLKNVDFTKRNWREFMNANQGIRIYRDRFRVRPYGEPTGKGDWLDLGIRRARSPGGVKQGGWKVGPHQVIGAVFIGRKTNPLLEDQTNREGIVESEAFYDMRAFCVKIIDRFELYAHQIAREEDDGSDTEEKKLLAKKAIADTTKEVEKLKESISKNLQETVDTGEQKDISANEPETLMVRIAEVESRLAEAAARSSELEIHLEKKAEELEHEKDTLANLASLGILTVCFGHEAKEFTNLSLVNAKNLKDSFEKGIFMLTPPYDEEFSNCLKTIISSTGFVRNFASFALGNIKPDKRKRRAVDIGDVASGVFKALSASLERQNIETSVTCETKRKIIAFEIDLESIFVNLISNSIWALKKTAVGERFISVNIHEKNDHITVSFADSGFGLESGTEEQIFQPMYSTRLDRKGSVEGTGMGLSIVKSFVDNHTGGNISAISKGRLGGAEFLINIPLNTNNKA